MPDCYEMDHVTKMTPAEARQPDECSHDHTHFMTVAITITMIITIAITMTITIAITIITYV